MTYIDRELAEAIWLETWEEMQLDDEMMRLWEEDQEKEARLQDEIEALIAQGVELPF